MKTTTLIAVIALLVAGCAAKIEPIAYGMDACHFCKMTIVDNQHAAQLVTVKGKNFKYDAVECMLNHLRDWEGPEIKYYLVADFKQPGQLVNAKDAYYLITPAIPSPMGENLTAFAAKSELEAILSQQTGDQHDWASLQNHFNVR